MLVPDPVSLLVCFSLVACVSSSSHVSPPQTDAIDSHIMLSRAPQHIRHHTKQHPQDLSHQSAFHKTYHNQGFISGLGYEKIKIIYIITRQFMGI